MHYYQFNIADFSLHTAHLTLEEEAVYRRLIDFYYDTESPIPKETQPVIRRLRLVNYITEVEQILSEFFTLDGDYYYNCRCDIEIKAYHDKAEKARANGRKGGRPKQNKAKKTPLVNSANPAETGLKANYKPLTINQELKTNTTSTKPKYEQEDLRFAEWMFKILLEKLPNFKKPNLEKWASTVRMMREIDHREYPEMSDTWLFTRDDEFWQSNCLSAEKFRKQFDTLQAKMLGNKK